MIIGIIAWIIFALLIGMLGDNRKIGFAGAFFLSLLLSPVIGLIITLCSKDKEDEKYKAEVLNTQKQQQETLNKMQEAASVKSMTDELERLKKLKDEGVLSEEEFTLLKQKAMEGLKSDTPAKPKITFEDRTEKSGDKILHHLTFSDGIQGILYEKTLSGGYAINADDKYVFYKNKAAAVKALHIYIKSGKILAENRM